MNMDEIVSALAGAWPCRVCALPRSAHGPEWWPAWVRPHDYERAPEPEARCVVEEAPP